MSKIVLYYKLMIELCDACGKCVMHQSLYDDLTYGCPPSPDSVRILYTHHDDDMEVLHCKIRAAIRKRAAISHSISELSRQIELYPDDLDLKSDADAIDFCKKLMMRDEDCDFRTKVRDWSRNEQRKIKKNATEPDLPLSFRDYLDKYEKLRKRRQRKQK